MGAIAVDLNNTAEVITIGRRVLVAILGADGARVFINSCANERQRITDKEMAEIMAEAEAEIAALRPYSAGDYTAEKYEQPEPSHEELSAALWARQSEADAIMREHPEYTLRERIREQRRREMALQ